MIYISIFLERLVLFICLIFGKLCEGIPFGWKFDCEMMQHLAYIHYARMIPFKCLSLFERY